MVIVFAIADADGDGALSFEEISVIQRRIFDAVDADQSGTATPEELQGFDRTLSAAPALPGFELDLRPLRRLG